MIKPHVVERAGPLGALYAPRRVTLDMLKRSSLKTPTLIIGH